MDRGEALRLLEARLDDYRHLTHGEAAARAGGGEIVALTGPSGVEYQIEIQFRWDARPGGAVRILGAIDDGTLRGAFRPVSSGRIVQRPG